MILAPSKNYQACAETILTYWHTPKQLFWFHQNSSGDLSLRYDSAVRNFFGDFLSDSLSSIQQIDDP